MKNLNRSTIKKHMWITKLKGISSFKSWLPSTFLNNLQALSSNCKSLISHDCQHYFSGSIAAISQLNHRKHPSTEPRINPWSALPISSSFKVAITVVMWKCNLYLSHHSSNQPLSPCQWLFTSQWNPRPSWSSAQATSSSNIHYSCQPSLFFFFFSWSLKAWSRLPPWSLSIYC